MDGFEIIPESNKTTTNFPGAMESRIDLLGTDGNVDKKKEIKPEVVKDNGHAGSTIFFLFSVFVFLAVVGYTIFLFLERMNTMNSIRKVSSDLKNIEQTVNKEEIKELQVLSDKINYINNRLKKHYLFAEVFRSVNQNMRSSLQVTKYSINMKEESIVASFSVVAPSFKDMAEQTERMFTLRKEGKIDNFSLTGLGYEEDSKRVRFTINVFINKQKYSATLLNTNTSTI